MKTTPRPPVNVIEIFPFLSGKEKIAMRLHPRRGIEPDIRQSKLGGRFLWPKDEPWPTCTEPETALIEQYSFSALFDYSLGYSPANVWQSSHPQHNDFYVGILQLRFEDFPEIKFPSNTNLFQLLWCPRNHILNSLTCLVFWRNEREVTDSFSTLPLPSYPERHLVPHPCCLYPERVTEYPHITTLPDREKEIVEEWDEEREAAYQFLLSTASGIKVGGYPNWIQEAEVPICQCEREMEHLLTIDSSEFSPVTASRWCPVEDRQVWEEAMRTGNREAEEVAALVQVAAGLTIGDGGSAYLFICRECEGWPIQLVVQCS